MEITHFGATALASFLASSVECVEALTIVLAVAVSRGRPSALAGAAVGLGLLAGLVATLGPALHAIPLSWVQITIGALLVLFGMRWLRKAILRSAGIIALHDEAAAFSSELSALGAHNDAAVLRRWDFVAIGASLKAVVLEGIEVVFVVLAFATAGDAMLPAASGAIVAGILVSLTGVLLYRPLTRVPENTLKFAVGVMLSAFGTYWLGEGYGVSWPGADLALLALIGGYAAAALVGARLARGRVQRRIVFLPL